jgi:O-antigen/teichoic acid export membrane protein
MNLVMPVLQAISVLTMLLLPALVRERNVGVERMQRTMIAFLTLFCLGALVYLAVLWLMRDRVFPLFYGGKYAEYAGLPLFLTGMLPLGTCITAVLASALRAMERPDLLFWCSLASMLSALAIGIPMSAAWGVTGALSGLLVSSLITIIMQFRFCRRLSMEARCES